MPTRLNAILLIPVLVALVFGGFRVQSSVDTWNEAEEAHDIARLVEAAYDYSNALLNERDRSAEPLLDGRRNDPTVLKLRAATDRAKEAFDAEAENMPSKPGLERRLEQFREAEPQLEKLRQVAYTGRLDGVKTEEGYTEVQHFLMQFANELGLGSGNVTSYGRSVYAVALAKGAESLQRSIGMHLLLKPAEDPAELKRQLTAFSSYAYLERIAVEEFVGGGRPQDIALFENKMRQAQQAGKEKAAAARQAAEAQGKPFVAPPPMEDMIRAIAGGAEASELRRQGVTPQTWSAAATAKFDAYRTVETELVDSAVAETEQIAAESRIDTFVTGAIVLTALLIAFALAALMARSMSRSMLSLRTAAFDVAEQRLPMLVDQLSRTEPGRVDTRVEPIPITSTDEIGEVARAFDQVHREAVRLAAEQALLRGNVNAIFTNLSSRNQGLIERQLALITELENNEADPDQLENLFRLDHLATRMRRNGENLLVLAGEEPGRSWSRPVPLVDILRAASSEVEHYERVGMSSVPDSEIHGAAVTDLVHLLAELLENATSFSSPQTRVEVAATRLPDGRVMIEIHDKGIGLTAEDFADINHKLANPPTVDAAVSRRMGLFVVGRLADRHGIRVQLRPSGEQAGTTSLVMLPEAITQGGGAEEIEQDFTVSRIMPEQPAAAQPVFDQHLRSAADLGFDDSRFASEGEPVPDGAQYDALGRSLLREERRAALEGRRPDEPEGAWNETGDGYEYGDGHGAGDGYAARTGYETDGGSSSGGYAAGTADRSGYGQSGYDPGPEFPAGDQPGYDHRTSGWPEAESAPGVHEGTGERVGFERPGPSPSSYHSTTGAGLPRRDPGRRPHEEGPAAQHQVRAESPSQQPQQSLPQQPGSPENTGGQWSSTNDDRWGRAEKLRNPQAGGVTHSGLPRRVPRANLVEGTAAQSPQGGPQVSRAPEDVRGRLSNLHRGVRRGRNASDAHQNDRQGFGPGSTYDQER
ncbi:nitrate- and nitrite sensing domain-containing protein [Streptomyces sp. RKND-216]|uniref:sensor histidine kinase n=1 Tax=Streptomyces sp. RKND-216 TaxID=2562581 RepID=UPI001FFB0F38|nr:nitrate- and nitrite sensing domain-containing protein [Streptomyces sp. RKND-216]